VNRARLSGISSVAIAVVIAGACGGSVSTSGRGPTPSTTPPKLALAEAGTSAKPSAVGGGAAIFPERPTTYVLDARLADLGTSARVWRMNAHPVALADVQRFADILGLAATVTRTASGWQVQGTSAMLQVDVANGVAAVSYSQGVPGSTGGSIGSGGGVSPGGAVVNGPTKNAVPPASVAVPPPATTASAAPPPAAASPVDVPDAKAAETIARTLLDHLGVLAGQSWSTAVSDSGGVAVACPVGVPCPLVSPEVFARTVAFSLTLEGARVDGVEWSVTIGEHRRIESLNGEWATPTTIGEYPLRSAAAVFADLQHGTARYAGPIPMMAYAGTGAEQAPAIATTPALSALSVHVSGASLGVARWSAYDNGQPVVDLVPTYRFHARGDGGTPYDIVVLALEPGAITFTNPVPTPKPLPPEPAPAPTAVPGSPPPSG
jgi:hypothetical protein